MFEGIDLNFIWFVLIAFLFIGYAVLDGFDLGVGTLHLFTNDDSERRVLLNAIGPVWDGNEVWLVTGGGALFAAFPHAYATVFSGFYIPFMILLFAIIFRAVSIEFRSKSESKQWRHTWDVAFSISSVLIALLMGVALGNIIIGVPIQANFELRTTLFSLLTPYPVLVGITTVALFAMHGAIYATTKTEGELKAKLRKWANTSMIAFIVLYVLTTIGTVIFVPSMFKNFSNSVFLYLVPLISILAIINIPIQLNRGKEFRAFISSCVAIATLLVLFAIGIFPNIVPATIAENSLTIYNASSSHKTLGVMLIIALIGMPLVITYTSIIYWIFRGKVKLDKSSY